MNYFNLTSSSHNFQLGLLSLKRAEGWKTRGGEGKCQGMKWKIPKPTNVPGWGQREQAVVRVGLKDRKAMER